MENITVNPKTPVIITLEEAKLAKKALINQQVSCLINSVRWKEEDRLADKIELGLTLTMTKKQIAQERQDFRRKGDLIKAEIEALTTVQEVENYVVNFN